MRSYNKREKTSVTKYNPILRNEQGHYKKDEWTSMSDIGRIYNGRLFTYEEYIETEAKYIEAVFLTMDFFRSKKIKISHIYKFNSKPFFKKRKAENLHDSYLRFTKGYSITSKEEIEAIIKLRLRELIGELELIVDSKSRTEILFGFDYYMYLKTNKDITDLVPKIQKLRLFVY